MRRIWHVTLIVASCACISDRVLGDCTPFTDVGPTLQAGTSPGCGNPFLDSAPQVTTLTKIEYRKIVWPDGFFKEFTAQSTGECRLYFPNCHFNIDLGFCSAAGDKKI